MVNLKADNDLDDNLAKLKCSLPKLRGTIAKINLSKLTWFRVGGEAIVYTAKDLDDLIYFLKNTYQKTKPYPLGMGSNLLVRDGGVDEVIIRLNQLNKVSSKNHQITAECGASDLKVSKFAFEHNLAGFAFLSGIPGTIGGALTMNAGSYGSEIKDILVHATGLTPQGELVHYSLNDMKYSYRSCAVDSIIWTSATFNGRPSTKHIISTEMEMIQSARTQSQPTKERTGGSTFKNPQNSSQSKEQLSLSAPLKKAWQLIDSVNLRGYKIGDACISDKHCNFLINQGNCKASDLEELGELAIKKVRQKHNIELKWELKIIGKP